MQKYRMFNVKNLAIAALLLLPMPFLPSSNLAAKADTATPAPAPVLISGTVKGYFTNRAGYVSALSLETSSGTEMVHFAPSWAKRLLTDNAVGSTLDGWFIAHQDGKWSWKDLVSIGKDPAERVLNGKIPSGAQQLDDQSWVWKNGTPGTVHGKLKKIVVNNKGDVLALILDTGALVRVPRTVRNEESGAYGTDAIAPLFKDVQVTAWGTQEWQASGDVSIYNQHFSTTGLAINGKTVGAIGIPRLPINKTFLIDGNMNLIDASPAEIVGADGEYVPFGNDMAMAQVKSTFTDSPLSAHIGHCMLQTSDGKSYQVVHQGIRIYAIIDKNVLRVPLVDNAYVIPASLPGSQLVMVMDDGRHFEMSSSDGNLYVDLPDGNKSKVSL